MPDLPGAQIGYLLTSSEFLLALAAKALHLDLLSMYHNAGGAIGSALVPLVYYLLLRRLGLAPLVALAGASGTLLFLLLDGNDHRAMGNMAFVRMWQGKAILLTLLPPYLLTHTVSFLSAGGRRPWLCAALAGVAATGLSTIGCFFAPAVIGASVLAVGGALLATRAVPFRLPSCRAGLMLTSVAWPLLALAVTLLAPVSGTYSALDLSRLARAHPNSRSRLLANLLDGSTASSSPGKLGASGLGSGPRRRGSAPGSAPPPGAPGGCVRTSLPRRGRQPGERPPAVLRSARGVLALRLPPSGAPVRRNARRGRRELAESRHSLPHTPCLRRSGDSAHRRLRGDAHDDDRLSGQLRLLLEAAYGVEAGPSRHRLHKPLARGARRPAGALGRAGRSGALPDGPSCACCCATPGKRSSPSDLLAASTRGSSACRPSVSSQAPATRLPT